MTVQITLSEIEMLAPNARISYLDAFLASQSVLAQYDISLTPLRLAHFMAQVLHECAGLTVQFENLNYSPARLVKVWPRRFLPKGPLDPATYAHSPEKLANMVYGGRLGNTDPGDGFKYRGRGLLQLTGKDSYHDATEILRLLNAQSPDFVQEPDLVFSAAWCVEVAAAAWFTRGCNEFADQDLIRSVTKRINGGLIGLAEREEWLKRTKQVWL
ncbi:MAG: lytic enzyme [Desulfobulbaceae bacterium A2]|nr:MAG: lytic enzyme [Desulfobulbaceae bacterium A2]